MVTNTRDRGVYHFPEIEGGGGGGSGDGKQAWFYGQWEGWYSPF